MRVISLRIFHFVFRGLLSVGITAGCATSQAGVSDPAQAYHCPAGTYDYGSGMVASRLPEDLEAALNEAHSRAIEQAGTDVSSDLVDQPWRPHISVIFGVTPDRALPAHQAMQGVLSHATATKACFGEMHIWDDAKGEKSYLVIDVVEPKNLLRALHDEVAQGAHIESRYAYHPHVTLLYLKGHKRLTAEQQMVIMAPLRGVCWLNDTFFVTNPCGQDLHVVAIAKVHE